MKRRNLKKKSTIILAAILILLSTTLPLVEAAKPTGKEKKTMDKPLSVKLFFLKNHRNPLFIHIIRDIFKGHNRNPAKGNDKDPSNNNRSPTKLPCPPGGSYCSACGEPISYRYVIIDGRCEKIQTTSLPCSWLSGWYEGEYRIYYCTESGGAHCEYKAIKSYSDNKHQ